MTLTREQVLSEPAGERLNRWVAEYVMGWEWVEGKVEHHSDFITVSPAYAFDPIHGGPHFEFKPSEYTHVALEMVEKLLERGFGGIKVEMFSNVVYCTIYDGDDVILSEALTVPLAICRAVLLAVMDE